MQSIELSVNTRNESNKYRNNIRKEFCVHDNLKFHDIDTSTNFVLLSLHRNIESVHVQIVCSHLLLDPRNDVVQGLNLIGLRRREIPNKEILSLSEAYKEIFKTKNLSENLANLDKKFKDNYLVQDVIDFINRDKKRPICTPHSL